MKKSPSHLSTFLGRLGSVGHGYADVARSPRYFPLWLAQLTSTFGDTLHYIALVILVYQLTGQGWRWRSSLRPKSSRCSCLVPSPAW